MKTINKIILASLIGLGSLNSYSQNNSKIDSTNYYLKLIKQNLDSSNKIADENLKRMKRTYELSLELVNYTDSLLHQGKYAKKDIYTDFKEFLKEKGRMDINLKNDTSYSISCNIKNNFLEERKEYYATLDKTFDNKIEKIALEYYSFKKEKEIGGEVFEDINVNGLNLNEEDSYETLDLNGIDSPFVIKINSTSFSALPPEKQKEIKQKYDNILKQIMHQNHFKNY